MAISAVKATLNGSTYTLTYNSTSGAYEATITSPSKSSYTQTNHYYPMTVMAYDESGNVKTITTSDSTYGTNLELFVTEKVAPVITVISPTSSAVLANSKPTISWTCSDTDSGIDSSTIALSIDGTAVSGITTSVSSGVYTCSYIPSTALSEGSHTLIFSVSDNDGNAGGTSLSFTVDTVPPVLNISSPTNGLKTNNATLTVSGTTNDAYSSPVTLTVNGTEVEVSSSGSFSTTVTLSSGSNTITIISTDALGQSTTITRSVHYSNVAPTISAISLTPNPVDAGKTFIISVTATANDDN